MPLQLAAEMGATELLGVDIDGIGIVRQNHTGLPTRIVRSHWNLGPTLDFDPSRAARNIALGYWGHPAAVRAHRRHSLRHPAGPGRVPETLCHKLSAAAGGRLRPCPRSGKGRKNRPPACRVSCALRAQSRRSHTGRPGPAGTGLRTLCTCRRICPTPQKCWRLPSWAASTRIPPTGFPPCWTARRAVWWLSAPWPPPCRKNSSPLWSAGH